MKYLNTIRKNYKPLYLIGQGYNNSFCPTFIKNHFLRNPHIYSPYTPYQSEISQGRLELLFNYQEMIKDINNMDVAINSMLDSGQVAMDLINLMYNYNNRNIIYYQDSMYQTIKNCMFTRAQHNNIKLIPFTSQNEILPLLKSKTISGIFFQNPTNIGDTQNLEWISDIKLYDKDILLACHTDLMFSTIHEPVGNYPFDFAFGNGCNFGIGLNFGGPQPSFLVSRKEFIRKIPGKLVGKTIDINDRECYRLALQTREQFIKREKATSNICTNQALLANMSVAWAMYNGNDGLLNIANTIMEKTKFFKNKLENNGIPSLNQTYFNTITLKNNKSLFEKLIDSNIYPYTTDELVSFSFDETINEDDINRVTDIVLDNYKNTSFNVIPSEYYVPKSKLRKDLPLKSEKLVKKYTEQEMIRYLHNLGSKDYSLLNGMIPLGSCTMKHTPVDSMNKVLDEKMNIHPYFPLEYSPYNEIYDSLSTKLCKLTGFDKVFYQSQSGAMGEYAGLTTIKNYHNNENRKYILMPKSAHGTNASSTSLAGYKIINLEETSEGMIDMDFFNSIIGKYNNEIAGLMITYPSTYGLYEKNIKEIINRIHTVSGLVYMDGANMNALIGREPLVSDLGFDLCHFNLHKTFAIPHGGGGPGMGPIAVKSKLENYLPKFSYSENCNSISTVPYGSGLIVQISEDYLDKLFKTDLKDFHKKLIDRTKYIISRLSEKYNIYNANSEYRAHEFIIDTSEFKKYNISEIDISKRLLDYGIHSPTNSWPIVRSLMIEITETESDEEVERFIESMLKIYDEIKTNPIILKNSPHTQFDIINWKNDYTIKEACYPLGDSMIDNKFWPLNNRVNDRYGDNLLLKDI